MPARMTRTNQQKPSQQKPSQQTEEKAMESETRIPCEYEHDFVLALAGITELSQEAEDSLFEAGCDDATISVRSGRIYLAFSRVAQSMREAILSAIHDVRKANIGAKVLRVDHCNLMTQAEIARKMGRSRQLVHQYITGARGPGNFPAPTCDITDGVALWRWCEVADWLWQNGMLKENALRAIQDVTAINSVLDFVHQKELNPDFVHHVFEYLTKPPLDPAPSKP
jgi:hypothetical protein